MILVLLADGFEEIEALTPVDMLRRAGLDVRTVGVTSRIAVGSHGISVVCDLVPGEVKLDEVSCVIFPGGMPGSLNLDASPFTDEIIRAVTENGGRLAAICAAPLVLGRRGLLAGKRATCYPGFEKELIGAAATGEDVVTDGNITTSKGMGTALKFSEELVALIAGEEKARELSLGVMSPLPYEIKKKSEAPSDDVILGYLTDGASGILSLSEKFKLKVNISDVKHGHRVTRYIVTSDKKTHITKLSKLEDDLMLELCSESVKITVASENELYVDVANKDAELVRSCDLTESYEFTNAPSKTAIPLGQDVERNIVFGDIAKMPHLIIAGATGTGKSNLINSIVTSLIKKCSPDELKLLFIDTKCVEFTQYSALPHLYAPIISDLGRSAEALAEATKLMEERYELLAKASARNIDEYNKRSEEKLSRLIIIIDELADLMLADRRGTEAGIMRIAQKARAVGIHLIISTQKPTVTVLSSGIIANIPARIAFKTVTLIDSKKIIGDSGAQRLLGAGDALYSLGFGQTPIRLQTPFISYDEVEKAVKEACDACGTR